MSLTFANFKQTIPSQILTRGREYVRRGQILDLSFDEDELVWEAQIEGTDLYDVQIEFFANGNLRCSCTCPYDMGEHCKHIAAVLYAIEDAFPDQLDLKPGDKSAKRQTRRDKLRQHLEKTSQERLVSILLELTQKDRELLNKLLIRLDVSDAKPIDYRRVVKDALRTGHDKQGYLDYTGSIRAGRKIGELFDQATQWLDTGETDKAIGVYQAVIDEIMPVLYRADDSSGTLGGCISMAIEGLNEAAELQEETGRDALFAYCLACAVKQEFQNWDWRWELLSIVQEWMSTPAQRTLLTSALDEIEASLIKGHDHNSMRDYGLEEVALFKLALIDRFDNPLASDEFLHAHVHLDRIRKELIERCIKDGKLEEALHQIQAGIALSEQQHLPGLTNQYQELRIQLLQKTGDKKGLIQATRALWLDTFSEENFALLRKLIPAPEWGAFVEKLIKDVRRTEQLAWLYAYEKRWPDLLTLVQKYAENSGWLLDNYQKPLESRFPAEVGAIYEKRVMQILTCAKTRDEYAKAADYVRRMKKIGQTARAQKLVQQVCAQYANRPALLDEFSKV
jgi:hypothetical protein